MKPSITLGFAIILFFVTSYLLAQPIESDHSFTDATLAENQNPELRKGHHALQLWHKSFHTVKPRTISDDNLIEGNTYNRHGELAFPTGYGVQVAAFKNVRNLRKYLHMYEQKDLYIQVISIENSESEKLYRIILGAEENRDFVEREISTFNKAGVQAVLRKHKDISASAMR